MKVLVISGSPNKNGLTANCVKQVQLGAEECSHEFIHFDINEMNIEKCRACDNGWGICRSEHLCIINDDLNESLAQIEKADAFVIVTPVYWWDMSESLKAYLDRVRRTEASKRWDNNMSYFSGKPVIAVAAAGGSGNGVVDCLGNIEKFIEHVGGEKYDLITITKKSKNYKLKTIKEATISLMSSCR